ncbi:hypothetical protein QUW15_14070 [Desulfovibrio piger]|nr:hypothetical protein [Desulfovibrio piger]
MKKIYLAFMCLALFPFSVNAASIEDILGEWQSEKPMPFTGIESIIISKDSIEIKPIKEPYPCKIEQVGESFKLNYLPEEFFGDAEEIYTIKDGKLLRDYPNAGGSRTQVYYIRPPKSPDHQ